LILAGAKNAPFFEPFVVDKTIILPRQARDKDGESNQKRSRFSRQAAQAVVAAAAAAAAAASRNYSTAVATHGYDASQIEHAPGAAYLLRSILV
jgi:hypothetical protein